MKGKSLNSSKLKNEHTKAFINIIHTSNWITGLFKQTFEKKELTMHQFNVLDILRSSTGQISQSQIRLQMLDKMSDTSRIVNRLINKGLAKKTINKRDKRLVNITISEKGKQELSKFELQENIMHQILKNISKKDTVILNELLDRIRDKDFLK
jgi:DNA-binding MarR family transcriptional regulator